MQHVGERAGHVIGGSMHGAKKGGITSHLAGVHMIPNCGREAMVPAEVVRRKKPLPKKSAGPDPRQEKKQQQELERERERRRREQERRQREKQRATGSRSRDRHKSRDRDSSSESRSRRRPRSESGDEKVDDEEKLRQEEEAKAAREAKRIRDMELFREREKVREEEERQRIKEFEIQKAQDKKLQEQRRKKLGGAFALDDDDDAEQEAAAARERRQKELELASRRVQVRDKSSEWLNQGFSISYSSTSSSSELAIVNASHAANASEPPRSLPPIGEGGKLSATDIDGSQHEHAFSKVWKDWDATKRDPGEVARQFMKIAAIKRRGVDGPPTDARGRPRRSRSRSRGRR
eukprot:gnl/TRDRNA2_/TRDRNA2_48916_c0_seq2.p1 gnl/TRDRNA2_/TRDRNA2_48916_c0~~gnl/TRDRNA2_/TRDRNA2_48916_c0_seq2.p1  ORF type:complete len:349 (-),score=78.59 gnl/TRDRNA2_/TRDRNA2_48916_c0_seq2:58-1104(-)